MNKRAERRSFAVETVAVATGFGGGKQLLLRPLRKNHCAENERIWYVDC